MVNTDWLDLKFVVYCLITNSTDCKYFAFAFCTTLFCIFAKSFGNFKNLLQKLNKKNYHKSTNMDSSKQRKQNNEEAERLARPMARRRARRTKAREDC